MKKINVKYIDTGRLVYDEEMQQFLCPHDDITVEKACCSSTGSSGYYECGCGGQDSLYCNNNNCTGILDWQIEDLFEREGYGY